jgi:transcriptional regulator
MYVRTSHRPRSTGDVVDVIRGNMFGTLVTTSTGVVASHLPFMIDEEQAPHGTLFAHMARANPQGAAIVRGGEVLVMFLGPHGYVSPSWYGDRRTAPTWDYVAVHCYGEVRVHTDDEARVNIERLVTLMEGDQRRPWSMAELGEEDVRQLLRNVVSFEITISRVEGKFKLNQGERPERTLAAVAELEQQGSTALASYIRRYNDL